MQEITHAPFRASSKSRNSRKLHHGPRILILPNAWDVASARVVEDLGAPAIATTSAGIAASLGYTDGQQISRDEMLDVVARIAAAVRVPVTADFEAGYGPSLEDIADSAKALVSAGAVGLNFEDITGPNESDHVELAPAGQKDPEACGKPPRPPWACRSSSTRARTSTCCPSARKRRASTARSSGCAPIAKPAPTASSRPPSPMPPTIRGCVKAVDAPLNILL